MPGRLESLPQWQAIHQLSTKSSRRQHTNKLQRLFGCIPSALCRSLEVPSTLSGFFLTCTTPPIDKFSAAMRFDTCSPCLPTFRAGRDPTATKPALCHPSLTREPVGTPVGSYSLQRNAYTTSNIAMTQDQYHDPLLAGTTTLSQDYRPLYYTSLLTALYTNAHTPHLPLVDPDSYTSGATPTASQPAETEWRTTYF